MRVLVCAAVLFMLLSGCASSPNAKVADALASNKAVIISPLTSSGGHLWDPVTKKGTPFDISNAAEAKTKIGDVYQMVVVEPGVYRLNTSTWPLGQGKAEPRGLVPGNQLGPLGLVLWVNEPYSERYTEQVWQDAVVQRVVVPDSGFCANMGPYGDCRQWVTNPGGAYDRVVRPAGYVNVTRYKAPVNVVRAAVSFRGAQTMAELEIKPGEVLLINSVEPQSNSMVFDDTRCTNDVKREGSFTCPLRGIRVAAADINLPYLQQVAAQSKALSPETLARVKPRLVAMGGRAIGRNSEQWTVFEFGAEVPAAVVPPSPPPQPATATKRRAGPLLKQ